MKLHIVGGFLGSGKTTAIIQASKLLTVQGLTTGVITNDQGKYLVDTAFFRLAAVPAVEVGGGCFCCNYDDLDSRLAKLITASHPDVIFAESVGSCADVVATVVKPLLQLGQDGVKPSSYSVFTDARMLLRRLLGKELPFSEDIVYIFDKQLEEAGLIVVNKMDLLSPQALDDFTRLLTERYPHTPFRLQSSLTSEGVQPWLDQIQSGELPLPTQSLEIDYRRYGAGEARLAWLDEAVTLSVPSGEGQRYVRGIVAEITRAIAQDAAGIGHLKFIIQGDGVGIKLSIPTLVEPGWEKDVPVIPGSSLSLLVNARVEMNAERLQTLLRQVLDQTGLSYAIQSEAAFHPSQPNPTHRFA